ncbi:MAG: ribokinase [Bacteroides sp.]|nr:ribokinase [Prevotella sp.]MCM1406906.1 ribokinase [Treponema brennaborense]MCM1470057.1 ribokinase [Bacteroides sp.]
MKILNFGSMNIDYVYSVSHFVCPGETARTERREVFPGGKGLNQSLALARAGSEVFHAGCVGKEDGLFLKQLLAQNGVQTDCIAELPCASGHAVIQVDASGQNCILLCGGANDMQSRTHIDRVFARFSAGDILVMQNEISETEYIMRKAFEKGLTVFFNPSPYTAETERLPLDGVGCFLLNEVEAAAMCGISGASAVSVAEGRTMLCMLAEKFPSAKIVLTLGKNGALFGDGETMYFHGCYDVPAVDTTAAGDTFAGYFIAGIACGMSAARALERASAAAALAVSRKGAAESIPSAAQVDDALAALQPLQSAFSALMRRASNTIF